MSTFPVEQSQESSKVDRSVADWRTYVEPPKLGNEWISRRAFEGVVSLFGTSGVGRRGVAQPGDSTSGSDDWSERTSSPCRADDVDSDAGMTERHLIDDRRNPNEMPYPVAIDGVRSDLWLHRAEKVDDFDREQSGMDIRKRGPSDL